MTLAAPTQRPLLTICVPTYNRAEHVVALVQFVCDNILDSTDYSVELIVSNNASTDKTAEALAPFISRGAKVIHIRQHMESAEENMIYSLDHATGEFIWFVGDDDIINLPAFDLMYSMVQCRMFDCLIHNSPVMTPTGRIRSLGPIKMSAAYIEGNIQQIIESIGLLYTFAGITNIIQRRDLLTSDRGKYWLGVSMIYSHVAWIAEANIGRKVAFFNTPLVFYRENDYGDRRWELAAERRNTQDLFNWTLGLCRLLSAMVSAGVLSYRQLGLVLELAQSGERYRLIDDILIKTCRQIEVWNQGRNLRQAWSSTELDEIICFLRSCDPTMFYPTAVLKIGHNDLLAMTNSRERDEAVERFRSRFGAATSERDLSGIMISRFRGLRFGFEVYETPFQFVAIHGAERDRLYLVLEEVDPLADGVDVLTAPSLEAIEPLARQAAERRLHERDVIASGRRSTSFEEIGRLRKRAEDAHKTLEMVLNSTSWKCSLPIRVLGRAMARLRKRGALTL